MTYRALTESCDPRPSPVSDDRVAEALDGLYSALGYTSTRGQGDVLTVVELESLLREVRDRRAAESMSAAARSLIRSIRRGRSARATWSPPTDSGTGDGDLSREQRSLLRELAAHFLARSRMRELDLGRDLGRELVLVSQSIVWGLLCSAGLSGDPPDDGDPREVIQWLAGSGGFWVAGDREAVITVLTDRVQCAVRSWRGRLDPSSSPSLGIARSLLRSLDARSGGVAQATGISSSDVVQS